MTKQKKEFISPIAEIIIFTQDDKVLTTISLPDQPFVHSENQVDEL